MPPPVLLPKPEYPDLSRLLSSSFFYTAEGALNEVSTFKERRVLASIL